MIAMRNTLILTMIFGVLQVTYAQPQFGPKIGLSIANIRHTVPGLETENSILLTAGLQFYSDLSNNISFQPGFMWNQRGFRSNDESIAGESYKVNYTVNYFTLDLNFGFGFNLGSTNTHFIIGPYIGMGLFGKQKNANPNENDRNIFGEVEVDESDLNGSKEDLFVNMFDYGGNIGFTFHVGHFMFQASYYLGLANMIPPLVSGTEGYKRYDMYNQGLQFSVVALFGGGE